MRCATYTCGLITLFVLCLVSAGFTADDDNDEDVAPEIPIETKLNGVTLGASFADVLKERGAPHHIGPAVASIPEVMAKLDPGSARNLIPNVPGTLSASGIPGMSTMPGAITTATTALLPAATASKLTNPLIVWMYQGNAKTGPTSTAGFCTFVIFNMRGIVEGVVVSMYDTAKPKPTGITTSTHFTFGSKMLDIAKVYNWPKMQKVGPYYFMSYSEQNVTYLVDLATRQVVGIAIGIHVATEYALQTPATGLQTQPRPGSSYQPQMPLPYPSASPGMLQYGPGGELIGGGPQYGPGGELMY